VPIFSSVILFLCLIPSCWSAERWLNFGKVSELSKQASSSDWPRFNGPSDDAKSPESFLIDSWPENGPRLLWSLKKGFGYASPAVVGNTLLLFHLDDGQERVEAVNAETGEPIWEFSYPVLYKDRYGYSAGPRASPVVYDGLVYVHGVTAWLTCLDLKTGQLVWQRDLTKEYQVPRYFFGKGSNPIVADNILVLNLGGEKRECMVGMDRKTGKTKWVLKDDWGASYSSPILAKIHGRKVGLALTGGESKPAKGGLLIFNPQNGERLVRFPWRSSKYESATACPPIYLGDGYVFLSECYDLGSVVLKVSPDFSVEVVWKNSKLGIHWMTPIEKDGYLYGVSGRHQQGAEVFCLAWKEGRVLWKEAISWKETILGRELNLQLFRASFLLVEQKFLCLSELGSLLWADFSPDGWKVEQSAQLFFAPESWTLPALSRGLLYIMQNDTDRVSGEGSRLLCYDFRGGLK